MKTSGWGATIEGANELRNFLKNAPQPMAEEATFRGTRRAMNRLKTAVVRAAPKKSGILKRSFKVFAKKKKLVVTLKLKDRYYYKTLEYGRKPHKRRGFAVAGSPQMARFAFFFKTVDSNTGNTLTMANDYTRTELLKIIPKYANRYGAPIKVK